MTYQAIPSQDAQRVADLLLAFLRGLRSGGNGHDPVAELPLAQLRLCNVLADGPRPMSEISREIGTSLRRGYADCRPIGACGLDQARAAGDNRRIRCLQLTEQGEEMMHPMIRCGSAACRRYRAIDRRRSPGGNPYIRDAGPSGGRRPRRRSRFRRAERFLHSDQGSAMKALFILLGVIVIVAGGAVLHRLPQRRPSHGLSPDRGQVGHGGFEHRCHRISRAARLDRRRTQVTGRNPEKYGSSRPTPRNGSTTAPTSRSGRCWPRSTRRFTRPI